MKAKVAVLTVVVLAVVILAGCVEEPTPTVSPIATPGAGLQVVPVRAAAQQESLTAEVVAAVVTVIISILLEVVPGLAEEWGKIDSTYKHLVWLVGCLLVPLAVLGAGCLGLDLGVAAPACDKQGVVEALRVSFAAYFMGQTAFGVKSLIERVIRKQRKR